MSCSPFPAGDVLPSGLSSDEWDGQPCACVRFKGVLHLGSVGSSVFIGDARVPLAAVEAGVAPVGILGGAASHHLLKAAEQWGKEPLLAPLSLSSACSFWWGSG